MNVLMHVLCCTPINFLILFLLCLCDLVYHVGNLNVRYNHCCKNKPYPKRHGAVSGGTLIFSPMEAASEQLMFVILTWAMFAKNQYGNKVGCGWLFYFLTKKLPKHLHLFSNILPPYLGVQLWDLSGRHKINQIFTPIGAIGFNTWKNIKVLPLA